MSLLLDTNVLSELRKGDRCDRQVAAWFASVGEEDLHLSVVVLGEIRRGVELVRPRDPSRARALEAWLDAVVTAFGDRIVPVDADIAAEWGRLGAARPVPVIDGLLAATAKVRGLTLVTRNVADVKDLGAALLDPFAWKPRRRRR